MSQVGDHQWAKEHCPIGCCYPDRWNAGCWQCVELYDVYEKNVPCKKFFDEIDAKVEDAVCRMNRVTADVPIIIDGRHVKEERTVVSLESVRAGIKPMAEELLRAIKRIAELEESTGGTVDAD